MVYSLWLVTAIATASGAKQEAGSKKQEAEGWMLDFRYWILDTGCWMFVIAIPPTAGEAIGSWFFIS